MGSITIEDLSREVQAIIGTQAWDGACTSDQPVCQADPRVTAQLSDSEPLPSELVMPWSIGNAPAGTVIVSPGGPSGLIGGLLYQLDIRQIYSHCGIMVTDYTEFRHATASADRINQFYDGSILGIGKAPTDGIKERQLRYMWPGTITQTVERAILSVTDRPIQRRADGEPKRDSNGVTIPLSGFGLLDTETGSSYLIDAMSFAPVLDVDGKGLVWPLVVTSCPALTTTAVENARRRLARIAKEVHGHYRLYAYTRADIAMDSDFEGGPSFEATAADPSCSGSRGVVSVGSTRPVVCSSFIWAVVQIANERAALAGEPHIVLDGRTLDMPHRADDLARRCRYGAFLPPEPIHDRMDSNTPDGLYLFGEAERQKAARWLHDYMVSKVRKEVDADLPDVWDQLGVAGGLGVTSLLSLLTNASFVAVAALLGIAPATLQELIILISDMPDDVANQLCNAFASDDCGKDAKDSRDWEYPGTGYAVSPDNIVHSWAPPTTFDRGIIHGLYGWNDRIRLEPPQFRRDAPPTGSTWQISQGFGTVSEGRVFFRDEAGNEVGVPGSSVRVGCAHFVSGTGGAIEGESLPSGTYWCVARYTNPDNGLIMKSDGQVVDIPADGSTGLFIELKAPPESRREVLIIGRMDLVNRYVFADDWWGHPEFVMGPVYLGLDYWPDEPQYAEQREASMSRLVKRSEQLDDWGQAELECQLHVETDYSVTVEWKARLKKDGDDPWQKHGTLVVPPRKYGSEPSVSMVVDLVRSPSLYPVRAHIEFEVRNDIAP